MRGIVGEERRGKEMDGCPLTFSISNVAGFFEKFAQILGKAMGSQGTKPKPSGYMYNSNAQAQNAAQTLLCIFCRTPGHFVSNCLVCQS
jgi:hypothetical protein